MALRRSFKILIGVLLFYLVLSVWPLYFVLKNNIDGLEFGVVILDVSRSCIFYLLNVLPWFAGIVVFFSLAWYLILHHKTKLLLEGKVPTSKRLGLMVLLVLGFYVFTSLSLVSYSVGYVKVAETSDPLVHHVFVVTFDGARADVFWESVKFIKNMLNVSVRAEHFVTVYPTITYPAHTSLFTGTWPQRHGVFENEPMRVEVEDIFEVVEKYGFKTAMVTGPSLGSMFGTSETIRSLGWYESSRSMDEALEIIENHEPNFMFVHLIDSDKAGHEYGSDSAEYRSAIAWNDQQVKRLYEKIVEMGWERDAVIIVTADHGMYGNRHHNVWPLLVIDVPLWMWGAPFKQNATIKGARIIDIAPTVAYLLGIPPPSSCVGYPILDAFNETYVEDIRGSVDLTDQLLKNLKNMVWLLYFEVFKGELVAGLMVLIVFLSPLLPLEQKRKYKEVKAKMG